MISYQSDINFSSKSRSGTSSPPKGIRSRETSVRDDAQLASGVSGGSPAGVWGKIADLRAEYKNRQVIPPWSNLRAPDLRFWLENLYNTDPEISSLVCSIFEQACRDLGNPSSGDDELTKAIDSVKGGLWLNFNRGLMQAGMARIGGRLTHEANMFEISIQPEYNQLVDFFSQRAQSPEQFESSKTVLNALTFNVYNDKDIEWWRKEYPKSKLAAIYAGKPQEEWIKLPE